MAKKLTVAEKKKVLEEQLAQLEILGAVEDEIKELIGNYNSYIEEELHETYQDGYETEQATSWKGELYWVIPDDVAKAIEPDSKWPTTKYTEKELLDAGYTLESAKAKPWYNPHYEKRRIEFDDLSDWSKDRVRKWRKVIELLEGIEIA